MGICKEELVKRLENLNAVEKRAISFRRAAEKEWEENYGEALKLAKKTLTDLLTEAFPSRIMTAAIKAGGDFGSLSDRIESFSMKVSDAVSTILFDIVLPGKRIPVKAFFEGTNCKLDIEHETDEVKCQKDIDDINDVIKEIDKMGELIPVVYERIACKLEESFLNGIEDLPDEAKDKLKNAMNDESISLYQRDEDTL